MMRVLRAGAFAAAVAALAAAVVMVGASSAGADPANFSFTATFTGVGPGSGAHCLWYLGQTTAPVRMVGRATVDFEAGECPVSLTADPLVFREYVQVTLTAPNGDWIVLGSGELTSLDPVAMFAGGEWHVIRASGRFTSYSGGGSYTAHYAGGAVALGFSGYLMPH